MADPDHITLMNSCRPKSTWQPGEVPPHFSKRLWNEVSEVSCFAVGLGVDVSKKVGAGAAAGSYGSELVPELATSKFYTLGHVGGYVIPGFGYLAAARDFTHGAGLVRSGIDARDKLRVVLGAREMFATAIPFVKFIGILGPAGSRIKEVGEQAWIGSTAATNPSPEWAPLRELVPKDPAASSEHPSAIGTPPETPSGVMPNVY